MWLVCKILGRLDEVVYTLAYRALCFLTRARRRLDVYFGAPNEKSHRWLDERK